MTTTATRRRRRVPFGKIADLLDELPHVFRDTRAGEGLSIGQVCLQSGLTSNAIWRLEHGHTLSTANLVKALRWLEQVAAKYEPTP